MYEKSLIWLVVKVAQADAFLNRDDLTEEQERKALMKRRVWQDEYDARMTELKPVTADSEKQRIAKQLAEQFEAGEFNDRHIAPQALLPESVGMAVYGWYDEVDEAFIGSETMGPGCDIEDAEAEAEMILEDLHAFELEDDADILHRWDRPEDDLEVLDAIAQNGLQFANDEVLLAYRRKQLDVMCRRFFGTADYMTREMVTRWDKNERGKWFPAEKMTVAEWITRKTEGEFELVEGEDGAVGVEAHGGTNLSGYMSCVRSLQFKIARKAQPKAKRGQLNAYVQRERILTTAQVEAVVNQAVAGVVEETVEGYFEL